LPVLESLLTFVGEVIDEKHAFTIGHSSRDAYYAYYIALAMDLSEQAAVNIRHATYLHDIGKLAIPPAILSKAEKLTAKEWVIVKKHAQRTVELLNSLPSLKVYAYGGYHHERWDGKGYPEGLKKDAIPLGSRIISVADTLDAMTSDRPYRETVTFKEALEEIKQASGIQFDPEVVDAAVRVFG
jgi:HD-GYP domain-containing protein (c-di-GMP phosphodiesterase class II)